jgi:DMSO reductase family type II enzyme heme b subunit
MTLQAIKLQLATKTLLNPIAPQWTKVPAEIVGLSGTPLHAQPSAYVRAAWATRAIGAVRQVSVKVAHNGEYAFFRLDWADENNNSDYGEGSTFPDAAAVLFRLEAQSPLETLGCPGGPVNMWYWRANRSDEGKNLVAQGPATEQPTTGPSIATRGTWDNGRWRLVIARTLATKNGDNVRLRPRSKVEVGFAVWEGSNQERAGLHSHSRAWRELEIE